MNRSRLDLLWNLNTSNETRQVLAEELLERHEQNQVKVLADRFYAEQARLERKRAEQPVGWQAYLSQFWDEPIPTRPLDIDICDEEWDDY